MNVRRRGFWGLLAVSHGACEPRYMELKAELRSENDRLLLGVIVEHLSAVLFAVAAVFRSAERQLVVGDLHGVDPRVAGLELVNGALGAGHVAGEDAGAQAVFR